MIDDIQEQFQVDRVRKTRASGVSECSRIPKEHKWACVFTILMMIVLLVILLSLMNQTMYCIINRIAIAASVG